ncbi:DUF928 domain-containing protein (plasmid) [Kovacikia minuta CCNUW1]|uniref:DUF928 domain-containing protein n=1 Tax=Kovacikia minuta TaxID=2931930 RepID=UPI001CCB374F|nr:DUF928 domain-containing protein [Kovacikia minuta]UBF30424.1 DUF928 domain-containing protein [Kovacikia minuta CCNUW1]
MDGFKQARNGLYPGIVGLSLSLSLMIAPLAWAGYRPPSRPSAPKQPGSNISRSGSCSSNSLGELTALAPLSHVGQTTSTHPTFAWFVPDQTSHPLEFRLFHNQQRLYRTEMQSQPGMMQFTLPQTEKGLMVGQDYRWQVVLVCNPNSPSSNIVTTAEVEVVQANSELQRQLAPLHTLQQRADLFANNGLWFDAFAEALKEPSNPAIALNLLDSLALVEAQHNQAWGDRLQQVRTSIRSSKGV